MGEIIGLTLAKINGIHHLDVTNSRWDVRRAIAGHVTGAGPKNAVGEEIPSGSFEQVIPRESDFNWRALKKFTVDIYDKETRSIVVASFSGCDWGSLGGSSDASSAMAKKSIAWNGERVNKA